MKSDVLLVKLALCGPGDVAPEIAIAKDVVTEWNIQHGEARGFWLKHQHWSTDSHPSLGDRAQAVINSQMVDDSDIIVAIFWSRFGSPTGAARSGTEEEISRGIKLGRMVMVYFSELEPLPPNAENAQREKLWRFRQDLQAKGLCWKFSSRDQFRKELSRHLAFKMNNVHKQEGGMDSPERSQCIVGDGNIQVGGDVNYYSSPPKAKTFITPAPGSISAAELKQIEARIEILAEGTMGVSR